MTKLVTGEIRRNKIQYFGESGHTLVTTSIESVTKSFCLHIKRSPFCFEDMRKGLESYIENLWWIG